MARFQITGLPQKQANVNSKESTVKKSLSPVDRSKANLEAEKGETVFTKMSETDNYPEFYEIGGKPHSEGGTPLNLPTGNAETGKGSSFIFSKKLTENDASTLEFFGMNPKKKVSFADISKRWLDVMNASKQILKDKNSDKISISSAKKNMDSAVVKLSALALKQEASKGMPNGSSAMFQPFLDKIGIGMDSILNPSEEGVEPATEGVFALGGNAFEKYPFPKFGDGAEANNKTTKPTKQKFNKETDEDIKRYFNGNLDLANSYAYLKSLTENPAIAAEITKKANALAQDADVSTENIRKTFKPLSEKEAVDNFLKSQLRNLAIEAHGITPDKIPTNKQGQQHVAINAKLEELGLKDLAIDPMNVWKEQAGRSAMHSLVETRDTYKGKDGFGKQLDPVASMKLGKPDEKYRNILGIPISKIDGVIGDTYGFETFKYQGEPIDETNPKDTKSTVDKGKVINLPNGDQSVEVPYGFRQEDLNSLHRAINARVNVKKYMPWSVTPSMEAPEGQFYDPTANINAINAQANQALQSQQAYGDAQSSTANAIAINAAAMNQSNQALNTIADQNVSASNAINSTRAQILNQRNAMEAQNAQGNYDKTTVANQQYDNAINLAKDKITTLANQTLTNASNIFNLNQTQDNYIIDPITGKSRLLKGRGVKNVGEEEDFASVYAELDKTIPGLSPETKAKIAMGKLSGKWVYEKDDTPTNS